MKTRPRFPTQLNADEYKTVLPRGSTAKLSIYSLQFLTNPYQAKNSRNVLKIPTVIRNHLPYYHLKYIQNPSNKSRRISNITKRAQKLYINNHFPNFCKANIHTQQGTTYNYSLTFLKAKDQEHLLFSLLIKTQLQMRSSTLYTLYHNYTARSRALVTIITILPQSQAIYYQ